MIGRKSMVSKCEVCGKRIEPGEQFILEGSYPTIGRIFSQTNFKYRTAPESYGKIFHRKCYVSQNKKQPQKAESLKILPEKKVQDKTVKRLIEGYEEGAEEDLEIAKDFEASENELDKNCDK